MIGCIRGRRGRREKETFGVRTFRESERLEEEREKQRKMEGEKSSILDL